MSSRGPITQRSERTLLALLGALSVANAAACSRSIEVAELGVQGESGDAGCVVVTCQGRVAECGDCEDNDLDGVADERDPDCWGACHDTEENWAPRQQCSNESCFFDDNCGLGNDDECVDLAPNGCDCHGCCEVGGQGRAVFLGTVDPDGEATCGAASVEDEVACASCELDEQCVNACEAGERCF